MLIAAGNEADRYHRSVIGMEDGGPDEEFHATVITGAIGGVAFARMIKDNQARPIRRAAA